MKFNILLCLILCSCSSSKRAPSSAPMPFEVIENQTWYEDKIETSNDAQIPLDIDSNNLYLDLRGTGDTAWSYGSPPSTGSKIPMPATMDKALLKYDPRKDLFVGDLSFTNFETVVGEKCESIRQSVDFYFLTNPKSITQAVNHGFNIIGLANNHSQDCNSGRAFLTSTTKHGALMTEESMSTIKPSAPFHWSGVGAQNKNIKVKEFIIKGKAIRVALGSVTLLSWEIPNANVINFTQPNLDEKITALLKQYDEVESDFKIIAIHTQDASGHRKPEKEAFLVLKKIAQRFIEEHDGDVAFGHGPHTFGGVKLVEKKDKSHGVIFTSLGNFIHDGLASNPDNYVARAVFDLEKLKIKQVQVLPFTNNRKTTVGKTPVTYYAPTEMNKAKKGNKVNSNFDWRTGTFLDHEGKSRGLFFASFK